MKQEQPTHCSAAYSASSRERAVKNRGDPSFMANNGANRDLESEHPNFFYNFFNCCHTATHMQTYIQRNRQSARFTTEGISFLFVDTKRAP